MAKVGRPKGSGSLYTEEQAAAICESVGGGETLQATCRAMGINPRTVYDWLAEHESFASEFARARVTGFDAIAAETLRIADTPLEGVETIEKADGGVEMKRGDMLGHRKLQIETRLKLLAKWDPKRYGERLELDGALTVKRQAADLTDDELAAIAANRRPKDSNDR